jgi:hypothetical protein
MRLGGRVLDGGSMSIGRSARVAGLSEELLIACLTLEGNMRNCLCSVVGFCYGGLVDEGRGGG